MTNNTTIHQRFTVSYSFPVIFTHDVFGIHNHALADVLRSSGRQKNRVLIVIDSKVFDGTPGLIEKIEKYSSHYGGVMEFISSPVIIKGGEECKKDHAEVEKIHALIEKNHMCRHSFVLALGGGAVLDVAGFAAATAHRGLRLVRMPTTTLAQNDAGVGVKNGINAFGRKNFIGTFSPPYAIINDFDFLETLPARTLRAGLAEAVKVALIKDREFFDFLYNERRRLSAFVPEIMERVIIRCAELHIEHIGTSGDPFEYGSSRPLDFGHWSAHKIEELTDGEVQHGEAVAMGIALDSLYSRCSGLISEIELHKIFSTLEEIGFDLYHWALSWIDIAKAIREFQEHIGGELTLPLLKGIGEKVEVREIDTNLFKQCVNILADRNKGKESKNVYGELPDVGRAGPGNLLP